MSNVARGKFGFCIHTAQPHEALLSTCGSGKRITGREIGPALGLRRTQTGKTIGWVGGIFQGSAQHGDYVVRTVRLFHEALHTGMLHLKFEARVNE